MSRRARALAVLPGAITVAGMIATPLARRGGAPRRTLSTVVVAGLAATTAMSSARRWGVPRTASAALAVSLGAGLIERVGTDSGIPFGRYAYTDALQPQVGGVPAIVPMAWFAMAVPARETAHAALGARSTPLTRVAVGAAALTAWDLFLDPQMVGEGYWRWELSGRYRGIPLSNFVGWFITSLGVMTVLEIALPPKNEPSAALVGQYGYMAAMETLGFAVFFKDRIVAAAGGAGMLPIAGVAALRMLRRRSGA
jgi:uncharacterized membrane protein